MSTLTDLKNQAVSAVKQSDWQAAVELNQHILEISPEDVSAMNRLAIAHVQLKDTQTAKKILHTVLELDKNNKIALKNLDKINKNKLCIAPAFSRQNFIEEPGKTKTVALFRLAGKNVLESIAAGQLCDLKIKNRYISVEVGGIYIGALPEDISFRLAKLITDGNTYACFVRSCDTKNCEVYLRETFRSEKNQHVHSFMPSKLNLNPLSDIDEVVALEENIPIEIIETDTDSERTLDDFDNNDD